MARIIDIFHFNGEFDLLEIRLNLLDSMVDEFIILEAPTTFSGTAKPLYGLQKQERFKQWFDKIKYVVIDEDYTMAEVYQAQISKYTNGIPRWMREFMQKEAIMKAITHLNDDDICYIGDVDEIWTHHDPHGIEKLKLRVYTYYINLTSSEEFWGTIRCRYGDIKGKCLNDIRNDISNRTLDYQGWHFTNMGGIASVNKKILDQYNPELFNDDLRKYLPERFGKIDIIGRPFDLIVDESELPEWVREHKEEYTHLFYGN